MMLEETYPESIWKGTGKGEGQLDSGFNRKSSYACMKF